MYLFKDRVCIFIDWTGAFPAELWLWTSCSCVNKNKFKWGIVGCDSSTRWQAVLVQKRAVWMKTIACHSHETITVFVKIIKIQRLSRTSMSWTITSSLVTNIEWHLWLVTLWSTPFNSISCLLIILQMFQLAQEWVILALQTWWSSAQTSARHHSRSLSWSSCCGVMQTSLSSDQLTATHPSQQTTHRTMRPAYISSSQYLICSLHFFPICCWNPLLPSAKTALVMTNPQVATMHKTKQPQPKGQRVCCKNGSTQKVYVRAYMRWSKSWHGVANILLIVSHLV